MIAIVRQWPPPQAEDIRQADSIGKLHELVRLRPVHGLNGQIVRMKYVLHLFSELHCSSFVETGTYLGSTAVAAARLFNTRVFTVELLWRFYWISWLHARLTGQHHQIHFTRGDSRATLEGWLRGTAVGPRPMLYLDGHWFPDHPLRGEIEAAIQRGNCVVIIDDCRVEHDAGFGYDTQDFGSGSPWNFTIALDSIRDLLPASRVTALQPAYSSADETGLRRGTLVLLVDLAPPASHRDHFAASLFVDVLL